MRVASVSVRPAQTGHQHEIAVQAFQYCLKRLVHRGAENTDLVRGNNDPYTLQVYHKSFVADEQSCGIGCWNLQHHAAYMIIFMTSLVAYKPVEQCKTCVKGNQKAYKWVQDTEISVMDT